MEFGRVKGHWKEGTKKQNNYLKQDQILKECLKDQFKDDGYTVTNLHKH